MAVQNAAGKIEVARSQGSPKGPERDDRRRQRRARQLRHRHTRWATHGEPSVVNRTPRIIPVTRRLPSVHNGIIENYQEIKERLLNKGFSFVSQTDTEVVAQLLDYYYMGESAGNALDAITRMMLSDEKGYNAGRIDYRADHGWLTLDVPAHSGVLLSSGALV